MDPYVGGALIGGGANVLGGLLQGFQGPGEYEKLMMQIMKAREGRAGNLWGMLKGEYGNPSGFIRNTQASLAPYMNQVAGSASRRLGLDSGAAQGEIARAGYGQLMNALNQRQMSLLQMLGGLT